MNQVESRGKIDSGFRLHQIEISSTVKHFSWILPNLIRDYDSFFLLWLRLIFVFIDLFCGAEYEMEQLYVVFC